MKSRLTTLHFSSNRSGIYATPLTPKSYNCLIIPFSPPFQQRFNAVLQIWYVLLQCLGLTLVGIVSAEPPSGYNYNRPSSSYFSGGNGGGAGFISGGGSSFSGGGNLISVSPGPSSNEGQYVEPQLLEKIRQLLLQEEASASAHGGGGGGGGGGGYPSSQYGAPSPQYGVPSYQTRVVGVDLEGVRQAIQVAQYQQTSVGSGGGGYPSGPATSYAAPSGSYSAPSRPSGSYGAPF